jgi:YHS domain-containing protein/thiol-disulfide isomerase/thioredoxin
MKARIWTTAILLALSVGTSALGQPHGIRWLQDLEEAKRLAGQSNRLVLVHFWANWCQPCVRLEQEVFTKPGVATSLERFFVPVKLNTDHFPASAQRMGVVSLPTDVILMPNGQIVARVNSPSTADAYVGQMLQIASRAGESTGGMYAGSSSAPAIPAATAPPLVASVPTSVPYGPPVSGFSAPHYQNPPTGGVSGPGRVENPWAATPPGTAQHPAGSQPATAVPERATLPPASSAAIDPFAERRMAPSDRATPDQRFPASATGSGSTSVPMSQPVPQPEPYRATMMSEPGPAPQPGSIGLTGPAAGPAAGNLSPTVSSAPAEPAPSTLPLALDGYCPVTLKQQQKWTPGDRRWGVNHRGRLYLFTSQQAQQQFFQDPDTFSPVFSGADPVVAIDQGRAVEGRRQHGVFFGGRVYLFASEASLQTFSRNPRHYADGVRQAIQQESTRLGPR